MTTEPLPDWSVSVAALTDVGRQRDNNEDSFGIFALTGPTVAPGGTAVTDIGSGGLLLVVADGMGGHEAGEVASAMAVQGISSRVAAKLVGTDPADTAGRACALGEAVSETNQEIFAGGQTDGRHRMGTTVTAALLNQRSALFAQVGDSRAYLVRGDAIAQLTRDQSLVAELEARTGDPDEALRLAGGGRNVLLQALGTEPRVRVGLSQSELRRGDWLLLCSDGLTGLLADAEIGDLVRAAADAEGACRVLVERALERGGHDNVTVVAARFQGAAFSPASPGEEPQPRPVQLGGRKRFAVWEEQGGVGGARRGAGTAPDARPWWQSPQLVRIGLGLIAALLVLGGVTAYSRWRNAEIQGRERSAAAEAMARTRVEELQQRRQKDVQLAALAGSEMRRRMQQAAQAVYGAAPFSTLERELDAAAALRGQGQVAEAAAAFDRITAASGQLRRQLDEKDQALLGLGRAREAQRAAKGRAVGGAAAETARQALSVGNRLVAEGRFREAASSYEAARKGFAAAVQQADAPARASGADHMPPPLPPRASAQGDLGAPPLAPRAQPPQADRSNPPPLPPPRGDRNNPLPQPPRAQPPLPPRPAPVGAATPGRRPDPTDTGAPARLPGSPAVATRSSPPTRPATTRAAATPRRARPTAAERTPAAAPAPAKPAEAAPPPPQQAPAVPTAASSPAATGAASDTP